MDHEEAPYEAYPLHWPMDQPKTPAHKRVWGKFKGTQEQARKMIVEEVNRLILGPESRTHILTEPPIISTNMPLRRDGMPYAATRIIEDPGVAVYFQRAEQWICIACDQYDAIWKNMKAIAKTIEAMRGIERWGSRELLDRAFTGFEALPEKSEAVSCWTILEIKPTATKEEIKKAYRGKYRAASQVEDNESTLIILNEARTQALSAINSIQTS